MNPFVHLMVRDSMKHPAPPAHDFGMLTVIFRSLWSHEDQRKKFTTINQRR